MTNTELLISYTDVLLIPENSALPFSMPESTEIVKYDGKVPDFVSKLYQYIPGKRVMIETDSQLICNVAASIIETMETNIAFIRFGGEFIADKALEEIKKLENILVCEDGSQIILSAPMANGVFSTENNRIAVNGNDISGGTYQSLRKKRDNSLWGCLLPAEYSANALKGTLGRTDTPVDTNIMIAADLLDQIMNRSDASMLPDLDSVLIFGTNCLITSYKPYGNASLPSFFKDAAFLTLFGRHLSDVSSSNIISVILDGILHRDLPDHFINFLELTYYQNRTPGIDIWKNYLELCINDKRF